MTEIQERAEQVHFDLYVSGGSVQILPNATMAIQNIHHGDGTLMRAEHCVTPAESGLHESPAPPAKTEPSLFALFIPDEKTRLVYEARLRACPNTVVLCQTVLTDFYSDILSDYSSPRQLIKSSVFISSLLPYLTFKSGANIQSIRYGIRKYVLGEG